MTSPYLWLLSSLAVIPAVLFWQHQTVLMVFVFLFSATYVMLYRAVVRFETPRWLVLTKRALGPSALGRGSDKLPAPSQGATDHLHVAILMGCYNGGRYLQEQLDSFESQTHTNWTLWVSDDGSTDDSFEILERYKARWGADKLRVVTGPKQGFARNFLSLACRDEIQADYYCYSDQDDIWVPGKLERALKVLAARNVDHVAHLYCARTLLVDNDRRPLGYSPMFTREPGFQNALVQNVGGGNTMVFNRKARDVIARAGFDLDVVAHDWWTYIAVTAAGGDVVYDPKPALLYRQHGANLIGANISFAARIGRVRLLFKGQWRTWNAANERALARIDDVLPSAMRKTRDAFERARSASSIAERFKGYQESGVYRQTALGNLALILALLFKKI